MAENKKEIDALTGEEVKVANIKGEKFSIGDRVKVTENAKDLKNIKPTEITPEIKATEFVVVGVYKDNTYYVAKEDVKLHLKAEHLVKSE